MSVTWDPELYWRFAAERSRPFFDLLAQVHVPGARVIADLGCGNGALTAELARRYPAARVTGVDSSPEMLAEAKERYSSQAPRFDLVLSDVRDWEPTEPVDLVISNAMLQWVPDHLQLVGRIARFLSPGGVLALQVPGNFKEPSHQLLRRVASDPRWAGLLRAKAGGWPFSHEPTEYHDELAGAGLEATAWETTYLQVIEGKDAVLEWMRGTALRPVLSVLADEDATSFLEDYRELLRDAYPAGPHGTLLPYRRVFALGRSPGDLPSALSGLDHVQLAIPEGGEDEARRFYGGLLGLAELPKPPDMAQRGGCWFAGPGPIQVHLGVEAEFRPAKKAHIGLVLTGLAVFAERFAPAGRPVRWDDELAPRRRLFTEDPFGNRIELLEEARGR